VQSTKAAVWSHDYWLELFTPDIGVIWEAEASSARACNVLASFPKLSLWKAKMIISESC